MSCAARGHPSPYDVAFGYGGMPPHRDTPDVHGITIPSSMDGKLRVQLAARIANMIEATGCDYGVLNR